MYANAAKTDGLNSGAFIGCSLVGATELAETETSLIDLPPFDGVDAGDLLLLLDEASLCCSSGSACSTGAVKPSHVMMAMGHTEARAKSSLRFSLSRYNTAAEVDAAIGIVSNAVSKLRQLRPSGVGPVVRAGGN